MDNVSRTWRHRPISNVESRSIIQPNYEIVCSNLQSVQLYIDKWYVTSLTVQLIVFSLQRPVPPDPWNGVLDTLDIPPACPQPGEGVAYIEFHVPGFNYTSEDCLYLNIYTPKVSILYQMIFSIQCDVIRCNFRIIFFILLVSMYRYKSV